MKNNAYFYFCIFIVFSFFTSCQENEFEIISNENTLIKNDEISKLEIFTNAIDVFFKSNFPYYFESMTRRYKYNSEDFEDNEIENSVKKKFFEEKLKGIQSKIRLKNNSNQIIENSNLTILIKYTFENEKVFNYIKPYALLENNKIWNINETLQLDFSDVINFARTGKESDFVMDLSAADETKILKIHIPKNVTIEYYITAKNTIGYNNLGKTQETLYLAYPNKFYTGTAKEFGIFTSTSLKEKEILGFGSKILSENITDIWNGNIDNKTKTETVEKPKNGNSNNSFINQQKLKQEKESKYKQEKDKLLSEGWKDEEIQNGQLSTCYNFKPAKGKVKNHLEVIVGGGTDVSIKVMNLETEKCIRYVFINSGTTYKIDNIPEGKYYLKIAYGKDWLSKIENGKCIGKFVKNPLYEKGEDILDFNIQRNSNGRSIPSYKLSLDVVSSGISNSFNSQNISENDFNK